MNLSPPISQFDFADSTPVSEPAPLGLAKVMAITSGKGGVGKTFFSANLACALAKRGQRVLVVDADLGLANLDVVLNLHPKVTLHDVFAGTAKLESAIVRTKGEFDAILAGSGKVEFSQLTPQMRDGFLSLMDQVHDQYDVILLDTGAGISDVVLFAISLASEVLVLTTPEPTALTDAYATLKVLFTEQQRKLIRLVVNQTTRLGDGRAITTQLQQVLDRFVLTEPGQVMRLHHWGDIPADPSVRQAIMRRQLLMQVGPGCPSGRAIAALALKLEETVLKR